MHGVQNTQYAAYVCSAVVLLSVDCTN